MIGKSVSLYVLMFGMVFHAETLSSFFDLKVKFGFTLDVSHTLMTETPVSLEQCYDACLARKKCLSIEFQKLFRLCRLLSTDSNTAEVQFVFKKGTVYSEKSDWTKKYPELGCKDCDTEKTCLTEDNTVNCKVTECEKPDLLDIQSVILGNKLSVGSKILHKCKYMTNVSAESVCETNGHWSNQAFECPLDIDGKTFKIISSKNNKWWHYDGYGDKIVSSRYQPTDSFAKFFFSKQSDGFYKIMCTGLGHFIYDGFGASTPLGPFLQHLPNAQDDDNMLYKVTVESENYYRIQTKATGRYVRLDPDGFVSSRQNIQDEYSLFQFEEIP